MAGERCDVPTYEWIQQHIPVLINDNYWQTETGWIISCNYKVIKYLKLLNFKDITISTNYEFSLCFLYCDRFELVP